MPVTEGKSNRVDLELPSVLGTIDTIEQNAEQFAQRAGFDEDEVSQISLVCREAAVNAVVHGNKYSTEKKVSAAIDLTPTALRVCISDEGAGFDADKLADPLAAENLLRTSGRGVFLMRAIMDEVHFRQLSPGTEITLIKNRTRGEARGDMDIKNRQVDGVLVLDLGGKITMGEGSGQLRSAIQEALAAGSKKILVNLSAVSYVDSSGLGELVGGYTTVKNAGGDLKLLGLTKKVKDLLVITKLLTVFDTFEDEKTALASFA